MSKFTIHNHQLIISNKKNQITVDFDNIEKLELYRSQGSAYIYFKDFEKIKFAPIRSLFWFMLLSGLAKGVNFQKQKNRVFITFFSLKKDMNADTYYQICDEIEAKVPRVINMDNQHGQNPSDVDGTCQYCHKTFFYNVNIAPPVVVVCPHCQKLSMDAFCPKCGVGGLLAFDKNNKESWGGYLDKAVETKPDYWHCKNCQNSWQIPAKIYDKANFEIAKKS